MPASHQVILSNGQPVGMIRTDEYHTKFDFKQAFAFIKTMIERKIKVDAKTFNSLIVSAVRESTPQGRRAEYSICWLAVRFLNELWHSIFTTRSPWYDFLYYRLKVQKPNSRDDWMVFGSYLTDGIETGPTTPEQNIHEFFDRKFPMNW
ncbi:hypothetical protein F5Y13DRAFT_187042 [Hypoxylon sp. FL1857]|nr:hypothetical protein F5Y13DRAFT_187042 [Hypoxylon sp. FL1857]